MVTMVRVAVVPADQVGRREGSVQRFARNAHRVIALATDCVDDLVVARAQVLDGDVSAKFYVAKETHPRVRGHLLVGGGDALDVLMIRCDAAANHAERRRQPIKHIHTHGQVRRFEQRLRGIEPRWSRSNDRDAEWASDRAKGAHTSSRMSAYEDRSNASCRIRLVLSVVASDCAGEQHRRASRLEECPSYGVTLLYGAGGAARRA